VADCTTDGFCERCGAMFSCRLVNDERNGSEHYFCQLCGRTAIVSVTEMEARFGDRERSVLGFEIFVVEDNLANCECGGRFKMLGAPRCPSCRKVLSAPLATRWIEGNAQAAHSGRRWQRTWSGLFAIVIGERVVVDPWISESAR
jgi:hypothetical protein